MNEKSRRIIRQYKTQIIVLLFALVSLIISIIVIDDLIKIEKGYTTYKRANVTKKSQTASIIVMIITLYFVYNAYQTYMEKKTKANFSFLIASLLALVSASIRFVNIIKGEDIEGAEDILL